MVKDNKVFAKIPIDIFYENGEIYNRIGGKDAFIIYSLLTSRKTMLNQIHISLKDISNIVKFDSNMSRSKQRIIKALKSLKKYDYIDFNISLKTKRVDQTLIFSWIEQFKNSKGGWIKFYADDFELFDRIGATAYCIMWMLRMFKNRNKGYSFISIEYISNTLRCSKTKISNTIDLFRVSNLFTIKLGNYYYHSKLETYIRENNEYIYNENINHILKMSESEIFYILCHDVIQREIGVQEKRRCC